MEVVIDYSPRPLQRELHENLEKHRYSVIVAHRRFGKTVAVINHIIKQALLCKEEMPRYGYVAPFRNQAKQIAWDYLTKFTADIPGVYRNESDLKVGLPNKARIQLYGADNPDAMRGVYFDGIILDEVAQMRPEVWGEVIRPALSDREGWVVFIGTPKGVNQFYELYMTAIKDPEWYAALYDVNKTLRHHTRDNSDRAVITEKENEQAKKNMPANAYRQEYLCDFNASADNTLIPIDIVNRAAERKYNRIVFEQSPTIMGVDVAGFGDDQSSIILRKGVYAYNLFVINDGDPMHLVGVVVRLYDEHQPVAVFIDEIGVGHGVAGRLTELGYPVIRVNSSRKAANEFRFINKRAEMWDLMRLWLQEGGRIPDDKSLKSDLVAPTYKYDSRGRLQLERKEDMKARGLPSPDRGDALALTFAEPIHPRIGKPDKYPIAIDKDTLFENL